MSDINDIEHENQRADAPMDWKLSWLLKSGKEEEYILSDRGAAMRGLNETMATWGPELLRITLEQVPAR